MMRVESAQLGRFADSFASFSRIVNSLQRKYIKLEEEFAAQNERLARANRRLTELSAENLKANEFLNNILDSVSAGVIAADRDGRVTRANPAAARILGTEPSDLIGSSFEDLPVAGDDAPMSTELDTVPKEIETADGRQLRLSVSRSFLRDDGGTVHGAVEVFHDLTKLKKLEQELARLNTLAALGEMAATVAHEVRNPLSGIAGFAALLERDLDETDPHRKTVRKIIRGVETLNDTVATLLNYTRFKEITRRPVAYHDFLRATVDDFTQDRREEIERMDITVELPGEAESAEPEIDPVLMRQVMHNLMSNALQVLREGGRVAITHRLLDQGEAVARAGDRLLLGSDETILETTVCDNGPGIHEHHLEKIFAPFFSTRSGGNGLGLAIVWKVMKAHGGDVIARNNPEGGASFHLLLPIKIATKAGEPN